MEREGKFMDPGMASQMRHSIPPQQEESKKLKRLKKAGQDTGPEAPKVKDVNQIEQALFGDDNAEPEATKEAEHVALQPESKGDSKGNRMTK